MFRNKFKLFEADTGTGSGDTTTVTPPATTADSKPFATFATEAELQAAIDARVKERIDREKSKGAAAAAKAAADAEAKALAGNAQYKELSEKQAAQLAQLEAGLTANTEKAERYEKALTTLLAEQRKSYAPSVLALLDKLDPAEQLEWIAANPATTTPALSGVPASPRPAGDGSGDIVGTFLQEQATAAAKQRNPLRRG